MKKNTSHRSLVQRAIVWVAACFALTVLSLNAQTTYEYLSPVHNAGNVGVAGAWDSTVDVGGTWSTTMRPGTNLDGASDDDVRIRHNRPTGDNQNVRVFGDVGEIGSLLIGGVNVATSGSRNIVLQLRANSAIDIQGDLILGATGYGTGAANEAGQLNFSQGNASFTVNGNVLSDGNAGANNININQGATSEFNLVGDIDSTTARMAAGLDPGVPGTGTGGNQQIDFTVSRGEGLKFFGFSPQTLNLESLRIWDTGANAGTITQTIPPDVTINTLNGRIGSVNNNARTADGTLLVDGGTVNYTNGLIIGRANDQSGNAQNPARNDLANATGNLVVGDLDPGIVNIGGLVNLGQTLGIAPGNAQVANGNITVNTAGSLLTIGGGVDMGSDLTAGSTTSSSITVNDGTAVITGPITDWADSTANSSITVTGGELELLDAVGGPRDIDTLTFTGGIIDFTVYGGMPTLATNNTEVAATTGGSTIEVTTAAPGSTFSTADSVNWIGGDDAWDLDGAKWDGGVIPAEGFGPIGAGEAFTVISSTNAITGAADGVGLGTGGWILTQNANEIILTAGAAVGGGVAAARFDDAAADVTRASDINLEAAAGTGADATQIDIVDVNSLTISADLNVGGTTAGALVNQGNIADTATGGMSVSVTGNLNLADGSIYNLNEGSLDVGSTSISGPALNGELIINSSTLNPLTATGTVTVDHLRVGRDPGSNVNLTVDFPIVTGAMDIAEDGDAQGSVTIASGGSITTTRRFYVGGDQTNTNDLDTVGNLTLEAGGSLTVSGGNLDVGRGGTGTFTVNGGTYSQSTNNLVLGQNGADPDLNSGSLVINGGTLKLGDIADTLSNSNININSGGGTVTQTAGDVIINNVLNLCDSNAASGGNDSSYTITGGTLTVDNNIAYRGGTGDDTITIGGTAVVSVGGNIAMNTSSNNTLVMDTFTGSLTVDGNFAAGGPVNSKTVQFNVDQTSGVSPISVGGICNIAGVALVLGGNISDTTQGDFELFEVAGDISTTGSNLGLVDGAPLLVFGDGSGYVLSTREVESGNDGNDVWAIAQAAVDDDVDNDGMPFDYEAANGLNDNNPNDAAMDADGDGFSSLFEYLVGTLAGTFSSSPVFTVDWVSPTQVDIEYGPIADGITYEVRSSLDLTVVPFPTLVDSFAAGPGDVATSRIIMDASGGEDVECYQLEVSETP